VNPSLQALALDGPAGRRFALLHEPAGPPRGLVVHVHALAEEMNKSRRMVALAARALAADGFAVLVPDLLGCGDSDGDFGSATWAAWLADVRGAVAWLQARHPATAGATWLWGHRAGCLLATEAAAALPQPAHLLLWQPPAAGKVLLQQLLRLRVAAELADPAGGGKGAMREMQQALASGHAVTVAGYNLHPDLARGLERATLTAPVNPAQALWLEVSSSADGTLLPASQRVLEGWRAEGRPVQAQSVPGPAFWQTVEIEEAPALVQATRQAIGRPLPVAAAAAAAA
jgi:uncharacterized protein